MAGYTPSTRPTSLPRAGYARRSLGRPSPTCRPWRIQKTHQGDRNRGIVLAGWVWFPSLRSSPPPALPPPRSEASRFGSRMGGGGRAPPGGATRRWVASPPSFYVAELAAGVAIEPLQGRAPWMLAPLENQGAQGALYWVHRRTALCGSLAPGAFLFLFGLGAFSRKSRENRTEFRSQTSGCERPLQVRTTGTTTG